MGERKNWCYSNSPKNAFHLKNLLLSSSLCESHNLGHLLNSTKISEFFYRQSLIGQKKTVRWKKICRKQQQTLFFSEQLRSRASMDDGFRQKYFCSGAISRSASLSPYLYTLKRQIKTIVLSFLWDDYE